MTGPVCGAGRILHGGGPVAVPFRSCCTAALLAAHAGSARTGVAPSPGLPCAVAVPVDVGSLPAGVEPPVAVGEP